MNDNFEFDFFFNEVDIVREENPKELMDFEMISSKIIKLKINCVNKDINESGISIKRRKKDFEERLKWEIKNPGDEKICLYAFIYDKKGFITNDFILNINSHTTLTWNVTNIPKDTKKISLICKKRFNKNVIGTLTIQSVL